MNNAKHDASRIRKILDIRARARRVTVDEMLKGDCPICCRPRHDGFFRADARGHATMGCVDAHHAGAYIGERARWFARPEAQAIRAAELAGLPR